MLFSVPGMGRSYLWVDGIQAEPIAENTEKLTHFIWVDPEDLRLGVTVGKNPSSYNWGEVSYTPPEN